MDTGNGERDITGCGDKELASSNWARAISRRMRYRLCRRRRSSRTDLRNRTRTSMVARSRGRQSSIRRSGSRFFRCLWELRCLGRQRRPEWHAWKVKGDTDSPWIKRAIFQTLQDAHQRQALALSADVETQQLLLLTWRPRLLASAAARSERRRRDAAAGRVQGIHDDPAAVPSFLFPSVRPILRLNSFWFGRLGG